MVRRPRSWSAHTLPSVALLSLSLLGCAVSSAEDEQIGTSESELIVADTRGAAATTASTATGAKSGYVNVSPNRLTVDRGCQSGRDDDSDGLDDGCEAQLLHDRAPVLYMPFALDWIRPANVDWYLARSALRFHHDNCSDEQIAGIGKVDQNNLLSFRHATKQGFWSGCDHTSTFISSATGPWNDDQHFFLQPPDAVHSGSANPADWRVYGHAYPNRIGGTNLQYWFFYPYNDNAASFNHESDWESITVRLRADRSVDGVYFCLHGHCDNFRAPSQVTWAGGHPTGWVADGSHATYWSASACNNATFTQEGSGPNCTTTDEHRWFTWAGGKGTQLGYQGGGVVNVGEKGRPLNGQRFIDYGGTWGEQGSTETTSGKRTPSFQDDWDMDRL